MINLGHGNCLFNFLSREAIKTFPLTVSYQSDLVTTKLAFEVLYDGQLQSALKTIDRVEEFAVSHT